MSQGNFSCAELVTIQAKADEKWMDNQNRVDYEANVDVVTAIRAEQTATLAEIQNPNKDRTLTLNWTRSCDIVAEACSTDCDAGGVEAEAACKEYEITLCQEAGFTVREKLFRTLNQTKEEALAVNFLMASKALDEYWAEQIVTKINAEAGDNLYTDQFSQVLGNTEIPAAYWGPGLMSYFQLVMKKNKMSNPYLVSGVNLFQSYWNAQMNAGNLNGQGDAQRVKQIRTYFDLFNVDEVADKTTFLINRGIVGFFTKNYYGPTPVEYHNGANVTYYSVESKNIPGVRYDVVYKTRCVNDEIYHDFKLKTHGIVETAPLGCNQTNTGILAFKCA